MQNFGSTLSILFSISDILVSLKNNILSESTFNLSALNFTCVSDSSPDTYNTLP